MRRKRRITGRLKYPLIAVVIACAGALFLLRHGADRNTLPLSEKHQTGYRAEDRQKLELLIHQGAKDD